MENPIIISNINDFIFCPISIYYHQLYADIDKMIYTGEKQLNGSHIHEKVDEAGYATSSHILQGIDVYCEEFGIIGKIDLFDTKTGLLTERKNRIQTIYDGYVFQVYAQCLALREMGYTVNKIRLHSYSDNKNYDLPLPEDDVVMFEKFRKTISDIKTTDVSSFMPENSEKCSNCIYAPFCDRSLSISD